MSAHWGDTSGAESSSFRSHGNYGSFSYQNVWAAEGKHAMYPSQSACNGGGFWGADGCGDNRCWIEVIELIQTLMNVGEENPSQRFYDVILSCPREGHVTLWSLLSLGRVRFRCLYELQGKPAQASCLVSYAVLLTLPAARARRSARVFRLPVSRHLRVLLPMFGAPLRFIYAKNLDPRPQDDFEDFKFSIGTSF